MGGEGRAGKCQINGKHPESFELNERAYSCESSLRLPIIAPVSLSRLECPPLSAPLHFLLSSCVRGAGEGGEICVCCCVCDFVCKSTTRRRAAASDQRKRGRERERSEDRGKKRARERSRARERQREREEGRKGGREEGRNEGGVGGDIAQASESDRDSKSGGTGVGGRRWGGCHRARATSSRCWPHPTSTPSRCLCVENLSHLRAAAMRCAWVG